MIDIGASPLAPRSASHRESLPVGRLYAWGQCRGDIRVCSEHYDSDILADLSIAQVIIFTYVVNCLLSSVSAMRQLLDSETHGIDIWAHDQYVPENLNDHRSHFGSRYISGCCNLAGLFV